MLEREWDNWAESRRTYFFFNTPGSLMQESKRMLRQIEDSIAKVHRITAYVDCASDGKITGGT